MPPASELLTTYGPLALGWVVAVILYKEVVDMRKKLMEMIVSDIKIKMTMTQQLKELTAIIKKGFGE